MYQNRGVDCTVRRTVPMCENRRMDCTVRRRVREIRMEWRESIYSNRDTLNLNSNGPQIFEMCAARYVEFPEVRFETKIRATCCIKVATGVFQKAVDSCVYPYQYRPFSD
jgi:hypothetical protein